MDQTAAPLPQETKADLLKVSIAELTKTHDNLKKRSRIWKILLGSAVMISIGASYWLHPAAGLLTGSLYLVLFACCGAHSWCISVGDSDVVVA